MHALGNPWVSGVLGALALLGPGRPLLVDGALSLVRWVTCGWGGLAAGRLAGLLTWLH